MSWKDAPHPLNNLSHKFVLLFSHLVVSNSSVTLWTVVRQAPLSMGLPRQGYCPALLFLSLGYLPDAGIKLVSPALADRFSTAEAPGKPWVRSMSSLTLHSIKPSGSQYLWRSPFCPSPHHGSDTHSFPSRIIELRLDSSFPFFQCLFNPTDVRRAL